MTWEVRCIESAHVSKLWPLVAPLLKPAVDLSEGRYTMRAVFDSLRNGVSLLWVIYDENRDVHAALTARKAVYPCATYLSIDFLGGRSMADWLQQADKVLTEYALASGCNSGLELYGRSGWSRVLEPLGWKQTGVVLVKPLTGTENGHE